jgi:NAD(P)H-dependent FMN reductase
MRIIDIVPCFLPSFLLLSTVCSYMRQFDCENSPECTLYDQLVASDSGANIKRFNLKIILGSTRQGRNSDKIGNKLFEIAKKQSRFSAEIVDLRDYPVPFLADAVAPASRTIITDPVIQMWSEIIATADAFIIISPEYNGGYSGVLKNALDTLYKEWNNKPVAFITYSGGPSGGKCVAEQLNQVARALKLIPIDMVITIPFISKALDINGNLIDPDFEVKCNVTLDQLYEAIAKQSEK